MRFDANKAKVQLKLSLNRLNLAQAKKNTLNQNMRRDIGLLLKAGAILSNESVLIIIRKTRICSSSG